MSYRIELANPPLCFVSIPFGKKVNGTGSVINFDCIYQDLIRPCIIDSGLEPLRDDEEITGGIIQKSMFERLIYSKYAIFDLTLANPFTFYQLGVRHAVHPRSTVILFAGSISIALS